MDRMNEIDQVKEEKKKSQQKPSSPNHMSKTVTTCANNDPTLAVFVRDDGDLAISIARTKSCLKKRLNCIRDLPRSIDDLLTTEHLTRPPFSFLHTLVKIFVEKLSFANGLYDYRQLESAVLHPSPSSPSSTSSTSLWSKQEKIRFLFKVLVCISRITNQRVDIFVSPAKILSGQDVHATHYFLQCLVNASTIHPDLSMQKAMEVNEVGVVNVMYKKSVKTRNTMVRIQSILRGNLARVKLKNKSNASMNEKGRDDNCLKNDQIIIQIMKEKNAGKPNKKKNDTHNMGKQSILLGTGSTSNKTEENCSNSSTNIVESINFDLSTDNNDKSASCIRGRLLDDDTDIHKALDKSVTVTTTANKNNSKINVNIVSRRKENVPIIKPTNVTKSRKVIRRGDDYSKKRTHKKQSKALTSSSTITLSTIPEKKVVKKFKIVNGIKTIHELEVTKNKNDEEEKEKTKSRQEEIDCLLSQLKIKLKNLKNKESKLEEKVEAARQKEEHLLICESRVSRLATKLRKKEERMKQERMKQAIEIDKFRLGAAEMHIRDNDEARDKFEDYDDEDDNEVRYENLWKRACNNPTITDLRLKLEAKQNAMKKRQKKMVNLEKELTRRLEEVEEERKQMEEEKKAHYESVRNTARQKRKPLSANIVKSKAAKARRKDNEGEEDMIESKKESRRQAFLGNNVLLKQLAQITSAREKIASKIESRTKSTPIIVQENAPSKKTPTQMGSKSPPSLLRKRSDGNVLSNSNGSDNVPRSLVRYSSHYNNNERQNNNFG